MTIVYDALRVTYRDGTGELVVPAGERIRSLASAVTIHAVPSLISHDYDYFLEQDHDGWVLRAGCRRWKTVDEMRSHYRDPSWGDYGRRNETYREECLQIADVLESICAQQDILLVGDEAAQRVETRSSVISTFLRSRGTLGGVDEDDRSVVLNELSSDESRSPYLHGVFSPEELRDIADYAEKYALEIAEARATADEDEDEAPTPQPVPEW